MVSISKELAKEDFPETWKKQGWDINHFDYKVKVNVAIILFAMKWNKVIYTVMYMLPISLIFTIFFLVLFFFGMIPNKEIVTVKTVIWTHPLVS